MSGIVTPLTDIIEKLKTLEWENNSGETPPLHAAVWNNQLKYLQEGDSYDFPLPAAFVEVRFPGNCAQLGFGYTEIDVNFRIHIGMEQLDAGDGTLDQNLAIFELRDAIIALLTHFEPTACSRLMKVDEEPDYDHNSIYVYTIDFLCSFVDDKGKQHPVEVWPEDLDPPAEEFELSLIAAYKPLEILSVSYGGDALSIQYHLLAPEQQVKFTIPVEGLVDAETQVPGEHTFIQSDYTLSPGNYSLTATATDSEFTTAPFEFAVS